MNGFPVSERLRNGLWTGVDGSTRAEKRRQTVGPLNSYDPEYWAVVNAEMNSKNITE